MRQLATIGLTSLLVIGIALASASDPDHSSNSQASAHKTLDCARCHSLKSQATSFVSAQGRVELCTKCHDQSVEETTAWSDIFHQDKKRPCTDCHSFHNPSTIKTEDRQFSLSDQGMTSFICQTCHTPGQELALVSEGHRKAAASYYHTDQRSFSGESPSETCLNCHSEHGNYLVEADQRAIGINVSASHTFGVGLPQSPEMKRRSEIDQKIRLLNDKIECQSCHSLSSGKKDALVDYDHPYDLCLGCHSIKG